MSDKISIQHHKQYQLGELSITQLRKKYRKSKFWFLDKRRGSWLYSKRVKDWNGKNVQYRATTIKGWEAMTNQGLSKPESTPNKIVNSIKEIIEKEGMVLRSESLDYTNGIYTISFNDPAEEKKELNPPLFSHGYNKASNVPEDDWDTLYDTMSETIRKGRKKK